MRSRGARESRERWAAMDLGEIERRGRDVAV